jgi:hypothetical protein
MSVREECALDVLLFETDGETLVDIKCFRGGRADVSSEDIKREIHSGLMQYRLQPEMASKSPPKSGISQRDMNDLVRGLPIPA